MLKLLTLPLWGPFWLIGALFKARATVRAGRKTVPVRVTAPPRQVVVYVTVTATPARPDVAIPAPPDHAPRRARPG